MKLRPLAFAVLIVCLSVVFVMTVSVYGSPLQTNGEKAAAIESPSVALGQPGLSFRYVQTFGVTETPYFTDTTHLNRPQGLFIDGSDNMYVVEEQGNRLLKYNSSGVNTLVIGKAGMSYTDDYIFSTPADVALDTDGNIWVADNSRVVQYTPTGVISQSLPARDDSPWDLGNTNGRFDNAHGLAFDSVGRMYVSDSNNHRVQVYDMSTGSPVYSTTIGVTSVATSTNVGFNNPQHIAIAGNLLYVADAGNQRVQILDISNPVSPIYVATLGVTGQSGSDNDHFAYPAGVAVDANYIYVAEGDNNRVQIFNRTTRVFVATLNTGGWGQGNDQFWNPFDVAVDSAGNIYVADRFNYRVQEFNSSRNYTHTYGTTSVPYLTDNYHYNHPRVAIDGSNNMIVLEENGQRLIKLDSNGVSQWSVGVPGVEGDDTVHFQWPHGVAVDKTGNIYVADNTQVKIFRSNGTYSATLGTSSGTGDYQFNWATGIAVDNNGNIYVSDGSNHRVQVYNSNRIYVATLGITGVSGSDNGHFNYPIGIEADSVGNIYVADIGNCRVQKFNSSRVYQMTFGITGSCTDRFSDVSAEDVTVDAQGRVYVSGWDNRVEVFNSTGAYLTTIGGAWGSNSGQFRGASGVAVDSAGSVYVADFGNARIQKFAPGVPRWRQSNLNGFGNRAIDWIPSLAVFGNYLYAGTANYNESIFQVWRTTDGRNWQQTSPDLSNGVSSLATFNGYLYAGTWNGTVWRSPDGLSWTNVITGGFASSGKGLAHLTVFSNTLYAGTYCDDTTGGEIWQTANGTTWTPLVSNGLGDPNNCGVISSAVFGGQLYFGIGNWNGLEGAQIWRTDGTTVTAVITDGFGVSTNKAPGGLAVFDGALYVGVSNANGIQIWRSNSGNAGTWTQVVSDGFGNGHTNDRTGLVVFDGHLYLVAQNSTTGLEVWRTASGTNWEQVGFAGFGDSNNEYSEWSGATALFKSNLFIGITNFANGAELWQLLKQVYLPLVIRN